tara:strand:+ start:5422 stop:7113 length:1692 start_codon:yes stop_codon:yes gene_type:complete
MSGFLGLSERPALTGGEIKTAYEGQLDTNAFDDLAKDDLASLGFTYVDMAAFLADVRTIAAGRFVTVMSAGIVFKAVAGAGEIANAALQGFEVVKGPFCKERTASNLGELALCPNGTKGFIGGWQYVADSAKVGSESVGVDGVAPYGLAVMQHFGGKPETGFDNAGAFAAALAWIKQAQTVLTFTRGVWEYGSFTNYIGPNSAITFEEGASLLYTGTGTALSFDAFAGGGASDPFINNFDIHNLTLVGPNATVLVRGQGVARSHWSGRVNGTSGASGTIGWDLYSFNLSRAELRCSYVDGAVPYRGITLKAGTRAGTSMGACSNNVFLNTYPEGNSIGLQLAANGADQNKFVGGAPEACSVYGMLVGTECRYNSFEGMGFENLGATSGDVTDSGTYSRYLNCYSSEKIIIQGNGCKIDGGFFERVQIDASAVGTTVDDITVNNWATGAGGFFNNGTGTRQRKVYDADLGAYIYKPKPRYAVNIPASGTYWKNDQNVPVKVRLYGGTVTQVILRQNGDVWIEGNPVASGGSTGSTGIYLLMPEQEIAVSYSAAPEMNVITQEAM